MFLRIVFFCFYCFFFVFSQFVFAQKNIYEKFKQKYPQESAIMLDKKERILIEINDGKLKISNSHYVDKLLLSESQNYADEYIHFSNTFSEIQDIDACILTIDGKKYKKMPVTNIETKSEFQAGIFYDDTKIKHIIYPKVEIGSRAVISYNEIINDPHFLGAFYFSSYMPLENSEFSVSVPAEVKINYKVFHDQHKKIRFSQKKEGKNVVYTWKAENMEKYNFEDDAPSISHYVPHIVIYIDEYLKEGKTQKVLSNVHELFSWYQFLVKDINKNIDGNLKILVDSLVLNAKTDQERTQKIFYWVQDHIKYVAFEDGMSGFVPTEAAKVCSRRYGDCKDMASITTQMLNMAGIPASLTWIGSRALPYSYSELPTPMADNHMISTVKIQGKYYFLDATGQFVPLGMPTSFIQGKEALIAIDSQHYELVKVPIMPKESNVYEDINFLELRENMLLGKGNATFSGYQKIEVSQLIGSESAKKQEEMLAQLLQKGNAQFALKSHKIRNLAYKDSLTKIEYDYEIADYAKKTNHSIYLNLHLDKKYQNAFFNLSERLLDKEHEYKFVEKNTTYLQIPEGYQVNYLPPNQKFAQEFFGFELNYLQEKGRIILQKTFYLDTLLVKKADFESWNKMIDLLNESYLESVVLRRKG